MALPKFLKPCFPSYDLDSLDLQRNKKLIITQILNFGTERDLKWLGRAYSQRDFKEVLSQPERGVWLKEVLLYWLKVFNLKISKKAFQQAILDLRPHFGQK